MRDPAGNAGPRDALLDRRACRAPTRSTGSASDPRPSVDACEARRAPAVPRPACAGSTEPATRGRVTSSGPLSLRPRRREAGLLDLDLAALLLEGGLDLLGLVAGDAFLDGLRGRVDEVLGLLEAEAGELADDLDDRDLVRADLGQGRGELGLLLGGRGGLGGAAAAGGRSRGGRDRGRGGDAVALLERLMNSDSSRTVILSIASSRSSWVRTAMSVSPCRWPARRSRSMVRWSSAGAVTRLGLGLLIADLRERVAEVADVARRAGRPGVAIGACIPPASLASRTSRDGRLARRA